MNTMNKNIVNARVEWIAWQVKISDLQPQSELLACFYLTRVKR